MRHRRHARINIFSAWTIKQWQEPQTSSVSCRLASRQIAPWSLWYVFHKNHIYLINTVYYLYMYKWSLPMYILYLLFMSQLNKVLCELWSDKLCDLNAWNNPEVRILAVTEMVPDLIWPPNFFGPWEIWAPRSLGPAWKNHVMIFMRGPNFLGPIFLGDQTS